MSGLIGTLTAIYPEQVFLEINPEDIEAASPNHADYSYDVARRHALINRLVLNRFTDWLRTEAPIEEEFNTWPSVEDLPSIWEFVNGSALNIGHTRVVLIPQEAIDTDEFSVPQEWVDIPDWVADYYLGVQVNLEQGWLRVWGFVSHKTLKRKAEYDPVLRNYSVEGELLIEDLTVMWVARQFEETERAEVPALPKLFGDESDRISEVLGKSRGYSPRLLVTNSQPIDDSEVAFPKWGALMSKDNLREDLRKQRIKSLQPAPTNLSNWRKGIYEKAWQALEIPKWGYARSGPAEVIRGKVVDFGHRLNGEKVVLAIAAQPYPKIEGETEVEVKVHPTGEESLPIGLKLRVELESAGEEEVAREGADCIKLIFSESPGKTFRVQVSLADAVITEEFIV